ncbi:Uncharacterized protein PECH_002216 [Penicillium ucsense]|uniref:Ribosome recycling factor domain-containing protein n=1 Tax=Penicillium ucsense TaxID=2839758 RepID=A0A8J8WFG0_9EURO|nr:Uncharacterized protein PECM_001385 [Penicillium ucsense]KAF7731135.1 Uncharacterized protein PECH_002216 [Penicillium ucsense]
MQRLSITRLALLSSRSVPPCRSPAPLSRLTTATPRRSAAPQLRRPFTTSPALYKKKDKASSKKGSNADAESSGSSSSVAAAGADDPYDLSALHSGITNALSRLKDDLSKLRSGGRFNTAVLESLKVQLSKDGQDTARLGDLAQVVPKGGRMVTILVAEEDHIKPVSSAVISSNLSLTPQTDPHNALQLNIPIPPPTKESRDKNVQAARQAFEKAAGAVRDARGVIHKRLQDMQKKKIARPDDVRKAHDQMEKVAEKGQKDVKDLFDSAKKSLEQA